MYYGPHLSISDGFIAVLEEMQRLDIKACQIYSASRSNSAKQLNDEIRPLAARFKEIVQKRDYKVISHNSLVSNLCSPEDKTWNYSRTTLQHELFRCEALGIPYVVLHPGSNSDRAHGISRLVSALNAIRIPDGVKILLETMPGSGAQIGACKEDFDDIFAGLQHPEKFGLCFDTAHVFASHSSVVDYYNELNAAYDVPVIHFNNSKQKSLSRKDGHAKLSNGSITLSDMQLLYNTFKDKILIFEQPIKVQSNDDVVKDFVENIKE